MIKLRGSGRGEAIAQVLKISRCSWLPREGEKRAGKRSANVQSFLSLSLCRPPVGVRSRGGHKSKLRVLFPLPLLFPFRFPRHDAPAVLSLVVLPSRSSTILLATSMTDRATTSFSSFARAPVWISARVPHGARSTDHRAGPPPARPAAFATERR